MKDQLIHMRGDGSGCIELGEDRLISILLRYYTEQGFSITGVGEKKNGNYMFYFDEAPCPTTTTTPDPHTEYYQEKLQEQQKDAHPNSKKV